MDMSKPARTPNDPDHTPHPGPDHSGTRPAEGQPPSIDVPPPAPFKAPR